MSFSSDKSILAFHNFVGLSVSEGYIATDSEMNMVSFTIKYITNTTCLLI